MSATEMGATGVGATGVGATGVGAKRADALGAGTVGAAGRSTAGGWHAPLHLIAAASVTGFLLLTAAVLGWQTYTGTREALVSASDETIARISQSINERAQRMLQPADITLRLLAFGGLSRAETLDERLESLDAVSDVLDGNRLIDALFVGYHDGQFVLFRPLRSDEARQRAVAPPEATIMVQSISADAAGTLHGEFRYFDALQRPLGTAAKPNYTYDPRTRPWFQLAIATPETVLTDPYVFFTTHAVGVTLARRTRDARAVIGLDATLVDLAAELDRLRMTPGAKLAITDDRERVVAYDDPSLLSVATEDGGLRLATVDELGSEALSAAAAMARTGERKATASAGGRTWRLVAEPLAIMPRRTATMLMAVPTEELFAGARRVVSRQVAIALGILLLIMPVGWWMTQKLAEPLTRLARETARITAFDFSGGSPPRSRIAEVDQLAVATAHMKSTIARFLDTSVALSSEPELELMTAVVLSTVVAAVKGRSGALYLLPESGQTMERVRAHPDDIHGHAPYPEHLPVDAGHPHPVSQAAATGETQTGETQTGEPGAPGHQILAVSLRTRQGELVGVLAVELAVERRGMTGMAGERDARQGFLEALSGIVAVAIETRGLIESQKALLESFIHLIAAAIDAKSPYTGGHCQRVPALAKMLAQAAHDAQDGPFRDFTLTEEEWEALHLASWLHDCGKVTTPEYVVDKATKLETIHNRIHEIRMRFEVMKRDATVGYLQACLRGEDRDAAHARMEAEHKALDEDFAFVATCNVGGESMDAARIERLQAIALRTWMRTIDDRQGLSWEETHHKAGRPAEPLPAPERALADKPEHVVKRTAAERIGPDNPWGFKLAVPEHKLNRGELYNLAIGRGTLTAEDRFIINDHMVQTIIMLEKLPFPRHLRNVPEIAGGHHERMDGNGYPKRLKRDEMSVLARIMAVADVFEALTAADRPYKRANTLSQSVAIMAGMVKNNHLDPEIFRLFLESGVYRDYGKRFLGADQIDEVDVARFA